MFPLLGSLGKKSRIKKRQEAIVNMLNAHASEIVASAEFNEQNPFVRGYGVALAFTVPGLTGMTAAPPVGIFPPYEDREPPEQQVRNLASFLAWRQCIDAFGDIDSLSDDPEFIEDRRQDLMEACGVLFPTSNRSQELISRFRSLASDPDELQRLALQGTLQYPNVVGLQAMISNECLAGPAFDFGGPTDVADVFKFSMFSMELYNDAGATFRKRGNEIFRAHLANRGS